MRQRELNWPRPARPAGDGLSASEPLHLHPPDPQALSLQRMLRHVLPSLAWLDDDHLATKRFVDKIAELALERSFSALSREYGINEKTVRNIFYGRYKDDIDTAKFTQPEYMGIDEIDVAGGARGVITNLSNNTAIDEGLFDQDLSSILRADAQPRCLQGRFNGLHGPLKEPDTSAIPQGQGGGRKVPYPAHGRPGGRWRSLAGQE